MQHARSSNGRALPLALAGLALVAIVAAACGTATGNEPTPTPAPSTPVVSPAPIVTPAPGTPATPVPSLRPDGSDVQLEVADGHDVVVGVSDPNGLLTGARSGTGKDGMSVRWGDAIVRNLDANTIEVTWAAYAKDQVIGLLVVPSSEGVLLRFGQELPYPNTDAMGADRVLVFDFAEAVSAEAIVVEFTTADD